MDAISPTKGERTRDAIIEAAHPLFIKQGYHGTSMRQIAMSCGISPGSLYNHFPGKEDVFEAVFIENHPYREILPALMDAQGDDIETLVRNAATRLLDILSASPDFLNLMFIEIVEFNSIHVKDLFLMMFPKGLQIIQRMVTVGGDQIRPIPSVMLLRSFLGLFFSYYITEMLIAPVAPKEFMQDAMDHFVEIYLHGILVEG